MKNRVVASEDCVARVISSYYEGRDAGQHVSVDELSARYPEMAFEIRRGIEILERVGAMLRMRSQQSRGEPSRVASSSSLD